MSKILEVREIEIASLVMSEGQVRIRKIQADIDELATSIRIHGLLEPILVCSSHSGDGAFEVLAGQRRVLAHQRLGREKIMAAIIDEPVDGENAKAISLTENIIRRDLDTKDIIDACSWLYKRYGSARAVAKETGIPYAQVLKHLKYDRLLPELQSKVDSGEVSLNIALKAQDAVESLSGSAKSAEALDLAEALETMSGAERRQILQEKRANPEVPIRGILENFWNENERDRQILVTLPEAVHRALQSRAKEMNLTQDAVAARLICDAMTEDHYPGHRDGRGRQHR
ncbi:ParB/RepB/Spo0J family partition protein [Nonomuraea sp. NPDC049400]|uniref:ParB/RepB/Spo0J family partition protein n=1 Tax=Nonomuraea sp. NPDC049400 TaxID=3364352 RepID=UPI0037A781D7